MVKVYNTLFCSVSLFIFTSIFSITYSYILHCLERTSKRVFKSLISPASFFIVSLRSLTSAVFSRAFSRSFWENSSPFIWVSSLLKARFSSRRREFSLWTKLNWSGSWWPVFLIYLTLAFGELSVMDVEIVVVDENLGLIGREPDMYLKFWDISMFDENISLSKSSGCPNIIFISSTFRESLKLHDQIKSSLPSNKEEKSKTIWEKFSPQIKFIVFVVVKELGENFFVWFVAWMRWVFFVGEIIWFVLFIYR